VAFRRTVLKKFVKYFIRRRSTWLNSIIREAVLEQGFIPEIVRNHKYFPDWEKKGYHISENHFYHPIPDLSLLSEDYWVNPSGLRGIELNLPKQLEFLSEINEEYALHFNSLPLYKDEIKDPWEYYIQNHNFTSIDGEVLYSMIRKFKPRKIIEAGSGFTTFLISKAIEDEKKENKEYEAIFNAIEPYPRDFLRTNIPALTSFIEKEIQDVPVELFGSLEENDILFIDGTHTLKFGSDVEFEFFKILPILKVGVLIHFHDIFLPLPYPKEWVYEYGWFWNEQYLLQAFLMYNNSFEIIWSGSMMHNYYPQKLGGVFRSYKLLNGNPGSFWMRKIN
jgi:hypothetical protein